MSNIFYGNSVSAAKNLDRYLQQGIRPDVFSDKEAGKCGSKLLGKYDVLQIDEALARYPDAYVWVTYRKAGSTLTMLRGKIPPERIRFLEANLEYRKGCNYLGHFISYRKDSFSPCCVTGELPIVRTSGPVRDRLAQWQNYTAQLMADIKAGQKNGCEKCHLLVDGFFRKDVRLDTINLGSNQRGDICNFQCIYCFCEPTLNRLSETADGLTTYEVMKQLAEIPEYDTEDFVVQLSNGEFFANEQCGEMIDILLQSKWKICILSNLSIYSEGFSTLLKDGRVQQVTTSLDAGTAETFATVKRADCFDRVVDNLRKYSFARTKLVVKYIFIEGINDNDRDIDGFYETVKGIGDADNVFIGLSNDQKTHLAPFTANMRRLSLRIIGKAKADGIRVIGVKSYTNPKDVRFIDESYAAATAAPSAGAAAMGEAPFSPPARTASKNAGSARLEWNSACVFCGRCARKCPQKAISVGKAEKSWGFSGRKCILCGICARSCPKNSLFLVSAEERRTGNIQ
ncbi:MAG: radical SAM protein [Clostridiales Family XIII bacterium]|jgi:ferredoxin/pyruvate-formate lyase-activating enzyme|nr:radical SAM protein [Clostridiales Family XIII bacterium]